MTEVQAKVESLSAGQESLCAQLADQAVDIDPTRGVVKVNMCGEEPVLVAAFAVPAHAVLVGQAVREHVRELCRMASAHQLMRSYGSGQQQPCAGGSA